MSDNDSKPVFKYALVEVVAKAIVPSIQSSVVKGTPAIKIPLKISAPPIDNSFAFPAKCFTST